MLGLKWAQVDLKQGIVTLEVGMTKNDEPRTFYMDDELKEMFKARFRGRVIGCRMCSIGAGNGS